MVENGTPAALEQLLARMTALEAEASALRQEARIAREEAAAATQRAQAAEAAQQQVVSGQFTSSLIQELASLPAQVAAAVASQNKAQPRHLTDQEVLGNLPATQAWRRSSRRGPGSSRTTSCLSSQRLGG